MLITQPCDARHVDLVDGGDVGGRAAGQRHVLCDLFAQLAHRFDAIAKLRTGRWRRDRLVRWSRSGRDRRSGRGGRGTGGAPSDKTERVALGFTTTLSTAV